MASFIVCPILPFPNIYWWSFALQSSKILLDEHEHFEKMSFRNRYMLAGANGVITLSIPLQEGRQQRKPMSEIKICNKADWQKVHWRTLQSVYNRSPYFEFYKKELQNLYTQPYDLLVDFSMSSIDLLAKLLGKKMEIELASEYQNNYPNAVADIRTHFRSNQYDSSPEKFPTYYQIFEERLGFLPNLSMLDLLFSEAKNAPQYLPKLLI